MTNILQTVTVTANTSYILTGWFTVASGSISSGEFGARTTAGTVIGQTAISTSLTSFTQLTATFNSGSNTSIVIFGGAILGASSVLRMDDVSLTAPVTNIIQTVTTVAPNTNYTLSGYFTLASGSISGGNLGVRTTSYPYVVVAETPIAGSLASYGNISLFFNSGANTQLVIFAGGILGTGTILRMDDFSLLPGGMPPPPSPVTITSITPRTGSCGNNTPVTINGSGFKAGATVNFTDPSTGYRAPFTNVVVVDSNTITALTPNGHGENPPCTN